jgi:two-component system chemotaxis response regulator CheY
MGCKILIVDDSSVTRAVLKKTIGMTEVPVDEIFEASNGQEALSVLGSEDIDLVFADLNMPEMDGRELTTRIFAMADDGPAPTVVVVTTEASTSRIDELMAKGVKGYVHKPFTPEDIREVLADARPVETV